MTNRMYLTKSLFQRSIECSRKLTYTMWLHRQQQQQQALKRDGVPVHADPGKMLQEPTSPSAFLQHLAADGYRMNRYVQGLYDPNGNGILVDSTNTDDAVQQTQKLLMESSMNSSGSCSQPTTIYEGAILWKNFLIRTDILQVPPNTNTANDGNDHQRQQSPRLKLVEVKAKSWDTSLYSTTSYNTDDIRYHPMMTKDGTVIKSDYQSILYDIAYQYYVISQAYPQYTVTPTNHQNSNTISCSFVLPDKSKVNTAVPGLYNLLENDDPLHKQLRDIKLNELNPLKEPEILYTEIDVTCIIPYILHQPLHYPGCWNNGAQQRQQQPIKTFIDVIHEWNDVIEQYNNINEREIGDDELAQSDMNQFLYNSITQVGAPIGIHCKNCEFRSTSNNKHNPTTKVQTNIKSGFDCCWGPILKANSIVNSNNTTILNETTQKDDVGDGQKRISTTQSSSTSSSPQQQQLVIDLYYGGKIVTDMLEQNKYLLCEITKKDLKILDTTTTTTTTTDETVVKVEESKVKEGKKKKKKSKVSVAPVGISRKYRQWCQVQSSFTDSNSVVLDKDYLHKVLSEYEYPYHFIDFETIAPILPFTINKHPYEPIAFQFSHHILHEDGMTTQHATEFLYTTPGICPNSHFLHAIIDTFQNRYTNGTIFRWGSHENTILRFIFASTVGVADLPSISTMERFFGTGLSDDGIHISDVGIVQNGMIDLMSIILKGYYVKGSNGSASIKSLLLPTLQYSTHLRSLYEAPTYNSSNFENMQWWKEDVPGSGIPTDPYKLLLSTSTDDDTNESVAHGGDAITAYSILQRNDIETTRREQIEKSLLRYCELDTLAMVMIMQALIGHLK